jgi:hypothetical protein
MQLAFMAVVVSGVGLLLVVLAFATGDWGLLMGLIFVGVGLLTAWFVPAARREQNAHLTDAPPAAEGTVPFWRVGDLIRERLAGMPYTVEQEGSRIRVLAADSDVSGWAAAFAVRPGFEIVATRPGVAIIRDYARDRGLTVHVGASSNEIHEPVTAVLKETGWHSGSWASLPAISKGATIVGTIAGVGCVVTAVVLGVAAILGKF